MEREKCRERRVEREGKRRREGEGERGKGESKEKGTNSEGRLNRIDMQPFGSL